MAIPHYPTLMLPLLKKVADGQPHTFGELVRRLADEFALTEEERNQLKPSGRGLLFNNRVGWARTSLVKAGLLEPEGRGVVRITPRGQALLEEGQAELTDDMLAERFPEYAEWRRPSRGRRSLNETAERASDVADELPPEEQLEASYRRLRASVEEELLQAVKAMSPAFFERLVVDLLLRLGYGWSETSGEALGRSGDGGIDGVIRQDKLGLDLVYVQAKRWDNPVGSPVVRAFAGSLAAHRAKKGVLITTSTFTKDARADAERMGERIVLVDGQELAALMYETGLGVSTTATYEIRKVDSDYFDSED